MTNVLVFKHRWPLLQEDLEYSQVIEHHGTPTEVPAPFGAFIYMGGKWYHRSKEKVPWHYRPTTKEIEAHKVPKEIRAWALLLA